MEENRKKRTVKVGSRDSVLAIIQAEMVIEAIRRQDPELDVELVTMKTTGDRILDRTLDQIGGKGLFVKELDLALLRGEVDVTVHSFKDLPMEENPELPIVALGKREDPRDVMILPKGADSLESPGKPRERRPIGCASLRRRLQLEKLFPGWSTAPVRGNIQTRLRKLDGDPPLTVPAGSPAPGAEIVRTVGPSLEAEAAGVGSPAQEAEAAGVGSPAQEAGAARAGSPAPGADINGADTAVAGITSARCGMGLAGSGVYAALVLAAAGIRRLGLEDRISRVFTTDEILPAACQGIIAVQARAGEDTSYLAAFDDPDSHVIAAAERGFVRELDGGCSSPVAAYCTLTAKGIHLEGLYYGEASGETVRGGIDGSREDAEQLGVRLARRLREGGASGESGCPDGSRVSGADRGHGTAFGSVALVGAGPGDKGLLTLRGAELLAQAEVVVYDRLVSAEIRRMMPEGAEKIDVGKESSHHPVPQEEINQILLEQARRGRRVVRLKGGDPFVFGRGGEELELLAENGVAFEVVPGITSAIAASCYAGIPVTHRDYCSSVHIITGHARAGKALDIPFEALAKLHGTLVFLMGVSTLPALMEGLQKAGLPGDTPAAVVENGTRPNQRKLVSTVAELPAAAERAEIHSPAVILVGQVCTLSGRFDWFARRPLFGKRVIVTRPRESAGTLAQKLAALGAEVLEYPCIAVRKLAENGALAAAVKDLSRFRWLLFSSRNGVAIFFEELQRQKQDSRALAGLLIGAVGSQTAQELASHGIRVDCVPEVFDGEHLAKAAAARMKPGERVLVCDAALSGGGLERGLAEAGAEVERIPLYDTEYAGVDTGEIRARLEAGAVDCVTFTSGSTVEGFARSLPGMDFSQVNAACIGRQTAMAAERYGMRVLLSEKATIDSLAECVQEALSRASADQAD